MDYLKKIRELKKEKGLSNEKIAELSDVPETTIAKIMSGSTLDPRFETITRIIIALGGSVDQILGIAPENPEPTPSYEETVAPGYIDLLKANDDLIVEKEKHIEAQQQHIDSLEAEIQNLRREKSRILLFFAGFMFLIIIFLAYLIIDLTHGGGGMFKY